MATQDFYALLGVPDSASPDEIKKAYRKLAKQYHPDANPNNAAAVEKFKAISEAHGVLSDPEKKAKYDQMRRLGAFGGFGSRQPSSAGQQRTRRTAGQPEEQDLGDFGSFGLGDIFSSIFGKGRRTEENEGTEPVEVSVTVPFRTAAVGGKVPVTLTMNDACATCGGTGAEPGATMTACDECKGRGAISFGQGGFAVQRPCPACRGRGKVPSAKCHACSGIGELRTEKQILITVPPASETGTRVRLKGQGPRARAGARAPDSLVTFTVEPDTFFTRDGLDIMCQIPVSLSQCVRDPRVLPTSPAGPTSELKMPPASETGKNVRLKGQGLEKGGQKGDQIVTVQVKIPEHLTDDQELAFRAFVDSLKS